MPNFHHWQIIKSKWQINQPKRGRGFKGFINSMNVYTSHLQSFNFFFEILIRDGQMFFVQTKPPSFTASLLQTHLIWSERQIELSHWGTWLLHSNMCVWLRKRARSWLLWVGPHEGQRTAQVQYPQPVSKGLASFVVLAYWLPLLEKPFGLSLTKIEQPI